MKKIILSALIILLTLTVSGCNLRMSEPPAIEVTAGNKHIPYVVGLNQWNNIAYDREGTFHTLMRNTSLDDLPYVRLKEVISISFQGAIPDSMVLVGYVLDARGDIKYPPVKMKPIPFKLNHKQGSIILEEDPIVLLSSNSEDYEPGHTIRGFQLNCTWGDNSAEYGFILRTDATSR
jgi:hypothetical protein